MSSAPRRQIPTFGSAPAIKQDVPHLDSNDTPRTTHRGSKSHKPSRPQSKFSQSDEPSRKRSPLSQISSTSFEIDSKGDHLNIKYGSLDQRRIPLHKRRGYGAVIGLDRAGRITSAADGKSVVISSAGASHSSSKRLLNSARKVEDVDEFATQSHKTGDGRVEFWELEDDFLDLESPAAKRRHITEISPDPTSRSDASHSFSQRGQIEKRLRETPDDGPSWRALIQHYAMPGSDVSNASTEAQAMIDIRVSIFHKASKAVSDPHWKAYFTTRALQESSGLLEARALRTAWNDAIQRHPHSFQVWIRYFEYREANLVDASAESLRDEFESLLDSLSEDLNRKRLPQFLYHELHALLLLRYSLALRESGYNEFAIAIWQAVFEFALRGNEKGPNEDEEVTLSKFEDFWENESPRLGYLPSGNSVLASGKSEPRDTSSSKTNSWLDREIAEASCTLSKGSASAFLSQDVYHTVLFADISSCLTLVQPTFLTLYLSAFLVILGIPPMIETTTEFSKELDFLRVKACGHLSDVKTQSVGQDLGSSGLAVGSKFPTFYAEDLASRFDLFRYGGSISKYAILDDAGLHAREFYLRFLKALCMMDIGGTDARVVYLALESYYDPPQARKTAKVWLGEQSDNLGLYAAYACAELKTGKPERALHVLKTALSPGHPTQEMTVSYIWSWHLLKQGRLDEVGKFIIEMDNSKAVMNEESILLAQQFLLNMFAKAREASDLESIAHTAGLLALLSYTTADFEAAMSSYAMSLADLSASKQNLGRCLELIHQNRANLIHFHISRTPSYPPKRIRGLLAESVSAYPSNSILSSMHTELSQRFRIADRVREATENILLESKPSMNVQDGPNTDLSGFPELAAKISNLQAELSRNVELGSNSTTIRSAFEAIVNDESQPIITAQHRRLAIIWQMYFAWELSVAHRLLETKLRFSSALAGRPSDQDVFKACKAVFWRATRPCFWSKNIWLLPFKHLDVRSRPASMDSETAVRVGFLTPEELKSIYGLMQNKGIRLIVKWEDVEK